jgi:Holliday junction resolvase RusA-like endonuclease
VSEVYVEVKGIPVPQGSMSVFNGRICHGSKKLTAWRKLVAQALSGLDANTLLGPVYAYLVFELPRPATVKRARPSVKPDLDKLVRGALDAIEASGVVANDSQVCEIQAVKVYGDNPRLKLFLKELT